MGIPWCKTSSPPEEGIQMDAMVSRMTKLFLKSTAMSIIHTYWHWQDAEHIEVVLTEAWNCFFFSGLPRDRSSCGRWNGRSWTCLAWNGKTSFYRYISLTLNEEVVWTPFWLIVKFLCHPHCQLTFQPLVACSKSNSTIQKWLLNHKNVPAITNSRVKDLENVYYCIHQS